MKQRSVLSSAILVLGLAAIVVLGLAFAAEAKALKVGDIVYAEWTPNSWYHGKIDKSCEGGWHIKYDDGDQKCVTADKVVADVVPAATAVKVGAKVLAQWTNGKYYAGKVTAIAGGSYSIQFNDGDKGKVTLAQLRLF